MKLNELLEAEDKFKFSDLERIGFEKEMSEKEWEALCKKAYPDRIYFKETGKGGWSKLDSDKDGPFLKKSESDTWWVDASPTSGPLSGSNGKLVGTYIFSKGKGTGKIFYKLKTVDLE